MGLADIPLMRRSCRHPFGGGIMRCFYIQHSHDSVVCGSMQAFLDENRPGSRSSRTLAGAQNRSRESCKELSLVLGVSPVDLYGQQPKVRRPDLGP
jgi:hypothetical protein